MMAPWIERVRIYLDLLEQSLVALNDTLDNTRVGTTTLNSIAVEESTAVLTSCLQELEKAIAQRQELLDAEDVPVRGVSLRDVLQRCHESGADELTERCHRLSHDVDASRERAVSLFVCQFHLSDLSSHLLAIMRSGEDHGVTYQRGKTEVKRSGPSSSVFDKAA